MKNFSAKMKNGSSPLSRSSNGSGRKIAIPKEQKTPIQDVRDQLRAVDSGMVTKHPKDPRRAQPMKIPRLANPEGLRTAFADYINGNIKLSFRVSVTGHSVIQNLSYSSRFYT